MKNKSIDIQNYIDVKTLGKAKLRAITPAILLNRVSDISQADGFSLSAQNRYGREYIQEKNFTLITEYSFAETASKNHLRTNFDKMVQEVKKLATLSDLPVNLICEKSDRLSRNFTSKEILQKLVIGGLLRIHYYKDRKIFDENCGPADIFNDDIQTAVSKYAAANIGREARKGMKEKAMSGIFPGHAPLGYLNKRIHEGTTNKKGIAVIIVDPDERCVNGIKRIFELRANGLSYEGIKDQIIEENILPPNKAKSLCKTGIEKLLQNRFFLGKIKWMGEEYEGTHEIIIPKEHLNAVFNVIRGKHSIRPKGTFSNFLTCSTCGCTILFDPKNKEIKSTGEIKKFNYYHCSDGKGVHKESDERQVNISEDKIFEQFESLLESFHVDEKEVDAISNYLKAEHDKIIAQQRSQVKRDQQLIKTLEQQEDALLELLMSKTIDEASYQRKLKALRDERSILADQISRVQSNFLDGFLLASNSILELANSAKSLWKMKSNEERIKILKMVLSNQTLKGKTVEFALKKPYVALTKICDLRRLKKNLICEDEVLKNWCPRAESNHGHKDFQSFALPTELQGPKI